MTERVRRQVAEQATVTRLYRNRPNLLNLRRVLRTNGIYPPPDAAEV